MLESLRTHYQTSSLLHHPILGYLIESQGFKYHLHTHNAHIYISNLDLRPEVQTWTPNCFFNTSTWKSRKHPRFDMSTMEITIFFLHKPASSLVLPILINDSILPAVWTDLFGATLKLPFYPRPIHLRSLPTWITVIAS